MINHHICRCKYEWVVYKISFYPKALQLFTQRGVIKHYVVESMSPAYWLTLEWRWKRCFSWIFPQPGNPPPTFINVCKLKLSLNHYNGSFLKPKYVNYSPNSLKSSKKHFLVIFKTILQQVVLPLQVGLSPKELCGSALYWDHHLQEELYEFNGLWLYISYLQLKSWRVA